MTPTPKEKAKELVDKFLLEQISTPNWDKKFHAKQCALICVDEMLKTCPIDYGFGVGYNYGTTEDYWQEVKQEIELLKL